MPLFARRRNGSKPTPSVIIPVSVISIPVLLSTPTEGLALSASSGVYAGTTPITIDRQWQISDDGVSGWTSIVGEISLTLSTLTAGQVNKYVRISETASNSLGAASPSYSLAGQVVAANPPGSGTANVTWEAQAGSVEIAWGSEPWSEEYSNTYDATLGAATITGLESGTIYFKIRSLPNGIWYSLGTKAIT